MFFGWLDFSFKNATEFVRGVSVFLSTRIRTHGITLLYIFSLVLCRDYLFKTTNTKLIINTPDFLSLHLIPLLLDLTSLNPAFGSVVLPYPVTNIQSCSQSSYRTM